MIPSPGSTPATPPAPPPPAAATPAAPIDDRRDRVVGLVVVFAFSIGLGVGTVTIPLLALASGYDAASVGFLVATAAAMQLAGRLALPWLLGRFTDRSLTAISAVMMVAAFVLLIWSTALPVFIAAQLLQGAARAIFWTSSQAHAIRDQPEPIRRLVDLNVAGNAGTLVGPAVGGLLAAIGLTVALVAGAAGALVAVAGTAFLRAFPPFDRKRSEGTRRLLRRTGVDVACWASVVGGLWWSMMGSFVPVLLVGAGVGSIGVGWAITGLRGGGDVRAARAADGLAHAHRAGGPDRGGGRVRRARPHRAAAARPADRGRAAADRRRGGRLRHDAVARDGDARRVGATSRATPCR